MPTYKTTAEFAASQLRSVDWVTRHELLARLHRRRPGVHARILHLMTPDECLNGKDSMTELPEYTVIVMADRKPEHKLVQTKITKFFFRKQRR